MERVYSQNNEFALLKRRNTTIRCKINEREKDTQERDTDIIQPLTVADNKKKLHRKIEKRRRDKMNMYIMELSRMIPNCQSIPRKLDKLSILRMAVQHLKSIRGRGDVAPSQLHYRPSLLCDQKIKDLVLQIADGFLFAVSCDRGIILYVSESLTRVLNYGRSEIVGKSLYGMIHPKDVQTVKDQISSGEMRPREKLIDIKTMMPVDTDLGPGFSLSRFCSGARRSFFFRMNCKPDDLVGEKTYNVVHCTGYLKSVECFLSSGADTETYQFTENMDKQKSAGSAITKMDCLVAVGRLLKEPYQSTRINHPYKRIQFLSRHSLEGKFMFVDQSATLLFGFLPQELIGTSMYEHFHVEDIKYLTESHRRVLQTDETVTTKVYRFRKKDGGFILIQSQWRSFVNPWTQNIEYITAVNNARWLFNTTKSVINTNDLLCEFYQTQCNTYSSSALTENDVNADLTENSLISHVEASRIGKQISDTIHKSSECRKKPCSKSQFTASEVINNNYSLLKTIVAGKENDKFQSSNMEFPLCSYNNIPDDAETIFNQLWHCVTPATASPNSINSNDDASMSTMMNMSSNVYQGYNVEDEFSSHAAYNLF